MAQLSRFKMSQERLDALKDELYYLETVREKGFGAVREYSLRFDKAEPRELTAAELDAA